MGNSKLWETSANVYLGTTNKLKRFSLQIYTNLKNVPESLENFEILEN